MVQVHGTARSSGTAGTACTSGTVCTNGSAGIVATSGTAGTSQLRWKIFSTGVLMLQVNSHQV